MKDLIELIIEGKNVLFFCDKGLENQYSKEIENHFMDRFNAVDAKSIMQIRKVLKKRFIIVTIEYGISGKVNEFIKCIRSTCQIKAVKVLKFSSENIKVGLNKNDIIQLKHGLNMLVNSLGLEIIKKWKKK